jgi:hypothetical protein
MRRAEWREYMQHQAVVRRRSIFDEKDKSKGANVLERLFSGQPISGANRFDVSGYCESLRGAVSSTVTAISGR